ncbi:hypothetical protein WK36_14565 [Burkholderia cepacia]|nr:hypothetical protein WK36_14565 [Burkholderia cepacia]
MPEEILQHPFGLECITVLDFDFETSFCIDLNRERFCTGMRVVANADFERRLLFVDKDIQDAHRFGNM